MKIAVSTTCSDGYVVLLDHLIKSVLKHNPKFNKDFLIFCDGRLRKENRDYLKKLYKKFKFVDCEWETYEKNYKGSIKYYSIESFALPNYDRVIYWGSDMLCMKSLDELFEVAETIGGIAMPKERRSGMYNNGSMIIGKEYLNVATYGNLLGFDIGKFPGHLQDQKLYNFFFKDVQEIDLKFNTLVSETDFISKNEIVLLHYIYKPTQEYAREFIPDWAIKEWEQYDNPGDRYAGIIG